MQVSSTAAIPARPSRSNGGRAKTFWKRVRSGDEIAFLVTFLSAVSVLAITALLVYELYEKSALSRDKFGWSFLVTSTWDPVAGQYGALPFIYGTLVTSGIALLIGIPLGVGAAIFLAELAPAGISSGLTFLIELLAAVPSVIIGLLGVFVMIPAMQAIEPAIRAVLGCPPLFQGPFYGVSLFPAGVVLAIMIL